MNICSTFLSMIQDWKEMMHATFNGKRPTN